MNEASMAKLNTVHARSYPGCPVYVTDNGKMCIIDPAILTALAESEACDSFAEHSNGTPTLAKVVDLVWEGADYVEIIRSILRRGVEGDRANRNSASDADVAFARLHWASAGYEFERSQTAIRDSAKNQERQAPDPGP